ncbi:MAG: alcohol dehydrogenase catalytic domain-containing protein [Candidatus Atribacteria bacterium]|nr:alcohol dehydrogenase catalytic domain-containing protein [Candidatus Atribacteria bacterium]
MKAAVYYGPGDLRVEECPLPEIGPGDILLKVGACAICGTDMRIFRHGHKGVKIPQIVGHEIAGTIAEVGKEVKGYTVGEKVAVDPIVSCGECFYCRRGLTNLCLTFKENYEAFGYYYPGGFAEYMRIPEKAIRRGNLIPIQDDLALEEAAIAEPMACALNGQMLSRVGVGDHVLIIGAGPIGCMHISLAKTLGATKVIISEFQEGRLNLARQFGADVYVNPMQEDLKEVLMKATNGIGPSVIIISAPARKAQEMALDLAANQARINFFGGLPKDDHLVSLDSNIIHYKELFIHGTSGTTSNHIQKCIELMAGKRVNASQIISKIISLEELPAMLIEAEKGNYLKIIVKP